MPYGDRVKTQQLRPALCSSCYKIGQPNTPSNLRFTCLLPGLFGCCGNACSGTCRSCKAWAEKLVGISDDTSLTATDKAKIKEEYGLWEQKTGINAKEGGVGILGIRTRQLMHERRLELLEALRDKPCALLLLLLSLTCLPASNVLLLG